MPTLRHLRGERRGDGHKAELLRAVVHRHLATLAQVLRVAVSLVHELVEGEAAVQQNACK